MCQAWSYPGTVDCGVEQRSQSYGGISWKIQAIVMERPSLQSDLEGDIAILLEVDVSCFEVGIIVKLLGNY